MNHDSIDLLDILPQDLSLKILAFGAGQQSTALALMSAENAIALKEGKKLPWPLVPIYHAVIFCDLQCEPQWVYEQVKFVKRIYEKIGLNLVELSFDLYDDHVNRVKNGRYIKMPLWTKNENGTKGKLRRACTIDHKIVAMQQYVRRELLHYKLRERLRSRDVGAHEMHIGFSYEERDRIFESKHPMFVNKYPLEEMGLTRKDNYSYCLETWGMDTKGNSCYICPFHKNYYFQYLRKNYPTDYEAVEAFDRVLSEKPMDGAVKSELYISSGLKRVWEIEAIECDDAQTFSYNGVRVWNGF